MVAIIWPQNIRKLHYEWLMLPLNNLDSVCWLLQRRLHNCSERLLEWREREDVRWMSITPAAHLPFSSLTPYAARQRVAAPRLVNAELQWSLTPPQPTLIQKLLVHAQARAFPLRAGATFTSWDPTFWGSFFLILESGLLGLKHHSHYQFVDGELAKSGST